MSEIGHAALQAAASGLFVFPVDEGDKRPATVRTRRIKWGSTATRDPKAIQAFWSHRPDCNYGIACKPSGLLVVDCDMPKESSVLPSMFRRPGVGVGEDVLASICEDLGQPFPHDTLMVRTPSGGAHYFFRNVDDVPLRQTSPVAGWIDVRGNGGDMGGYVLGPGSSLPAGKYRVENRAPIQRAPQWLLAICTEPPERPKPEYRPRPSGQPLSSGDMGPNSMVGLLNSVRGSQEGNRNNALMWAACKCAEEGVMLSVALSELGDAAREAGLDSSEIEPTIRSGYRRMGC